MTGQQLQGLYQSEKLCSFVKDHQFWLKRWVEHASASLQNNMPVYRTYQELKSHCIGKTNSTFLEEKDNRRGKGVFIYAEILCCFEAKGSDTSFWVWGNLLVSLFQSCWENKTAEKNFSCCYIRNSGLAAVLQEQIHGGIAGRRKQIH